MKILLCVPLALAACTTVESDNILTSGIHAQIAARASGDGTTDVSATLFLGNPANLNFVDLTGDDQLIASHGSDSRVMSETIILNIVGHHAVFPSDLEGDEFVVDFSRSVDGGAPESIASLPAPFELDPIAATSRAAALEVSWTPAGSLDAMHWEAIGECIEATSADIVDDTGLASIAPGTLRKRQGTNIPDSCSVTLTVVRSRPGDLDPGYGEGGTIAGEQIRKVMFTSNP